MRSPCASPGAATTGVRICCFFILFIITRCCYHGGREREGEGGREREKGRKRASVPREESSRGHSLLCHELVSRTRKRATVPLSSRGERRASTICDTITPPPATRATPTTPASASTRRRSPATKRTTSPGGRGSWPPIYIYMYICIYVYMCKCIYVYMYVCVYVHTFCVLINPPIPYITSSPLCLLHNFQSCEANT